MSPVVGAAGRYSFHWRREPGYVVPRIGRIGMVGKWEARELQERADELRELERELRRAWRERRDDEGDAVAGDGRDEYPAA